MYKLKDAVRERMNEEKGKIRTKKNRIFKHKRQKGVTEKM